MINPNDRYAIYFVNDCLLKDDVAPPDKAKAGKDYEILEQLYRVHKDYGRDAAKRAWQTLRKAGPHLDKRRKMFNIHDLKYVEPPEYALPQEDGTPFYAVYLKGLNVIYGKPGSNKTFIALDIANRIALANPERIVMFTAGEGGSGLYERQIAWETHNQRRVPNFHVYDEALPLLNVEAVEEFMFWMDGIKPVFIVIDTLARAMNGSNENDTAVMTHFVDECDKLMRLLDCGILLVHHTNAMGHMRGSSALDGGTDSILKVVPRDDQREVYNSLDNGGKNKHSEEAPVLYLNKLPVEIERDGKTKTSLVMVTSDKVIDEIEPGQRLKDNQMKICRALLGHKYLSVQEIVQISNVPIATAYRNLKKLVNAGYIEQPADETYTLTSAGEIACS